MKEIKKQVNAWIEANADGIVRDTVRLIKKYSPRTAGTEEKPFGEGPYEALMEFFSVCDDLGFAHQNMDICIGVADLGEGEPEIGILCHLDVVPIGPGWTMPATEGIVKDGKIFGRGAIDDKGPAVATLYAMKAIKEMGVELKKPVRFIVGTDEESGSEDIPHYKKYAKMPSMLFTPDGGYPVINIEKGMSRNEFARAYTVSEQLPRIAYAKGGATINAVPGEACCRIEGMNAAEAESYYHALPCGVKAAAAAVDGGVEISFKGTSAHASTPDEGINAVTGMIAYLSALPLANADEKETVSALCRLFPHGKVNGEGVNLDIKDEKSGALTCAFSVFSLENGKAAGKCDIRFPVCTSVPEVKERIGAALAAEQFELTASRGSEPHETPEEGAFVQTLLRTYHEETGNEAYCVAIGGGTYVHHEEGGVAFGAEFPGAADHHMHGPDEFVEIEELVLNAKIFAQAILNLQEV